MTKKMDYVLGGFIGFFAGIFMIPLLINIGNQGHPVVKGYAVLMLAPWVMALAVVCGIWLGKFLARRLAFFDQLSKFGAVGILNASIDFGVLNLFSILTGATAGIKIGGFNVPGVALAVVNSYLWNKHWVFKSTQQNRPDQDLAKFLAVTISGLILNSIFVVVATTYITPPLGLSGAAWLNVAKVLITAFTLIWNFLGYKFFVFVARDRNATLA